MVKKRPKKKKTVNQSYLIIDLAKRRFQYAPTHPWAYFFFHTISVKLWGGLIEEDSIKSLCGNMPSRPWVWRLLDSLPQVGGASEEMYTGWQICREMLTSNKVWKRFHLELLRKSHYWLRTPHTHLKTCNSLTMGSSSSSEGHQLLNKTKQVCLLGLLMARMVWAVFFLAIV